MTHVSLIYWRVSNVHGFGDGTILCKHNLARGEHSSSFRAKLAPIAKVLMPRQ